MKLAMTVLSCMLTAVFASVHLYAQHPAVDPTETSESGVVHAPAGQQEHPIAKGQIESMDFGRRVLSIKTKYGPRTFTYTERTYIFRGKEKISADKLTVGETIALRFHTDREGQVVVQRIKAQPADVEDAAEQLK